MYKRIYISLLCSFFPLFLIGGEHHTHEDGGIKFIENKGQWNAPILFRSDIPSGEMILEKNTLIYVFNHEEDMKRIHDIGHGKLPGSKPEDLIIRGHCFKMHFEGANLTPQVLATEPTTDVVNYFLGNDPEKWASDVKQFYHINYENIYPGVDYRIYSLGQNMKYDFVLSPGANPNKIKMRYEGLDEIFLWYGELHMTTSVNELVEQKPYAYQYINGEKKEVPCNFKLKGDQVQFDFPEGYNEQYELVIDPVVVFSTFSGSSKDNWGYTATYDNAGNLYGGGIVFRTYQGSTAGNYPAVGAYQSTFNGGQIDMGITKFSSDGSSLIYSTYIGGNDCDAPHSLVVNSNNELVILGSTGSNDYPTSSGAYDRTYNGGSNVGIGSSNFIRYRNGSDIVVTRMNANGNDISASTYIGGADNDGLNLSTMLVTNYGDESRGEVFVDNANNIYVSSSTQSITGFPTVNAIQNNFGGGSQDGCVFKLNSNMTNLIWSTYLGGSGEDACYSVQIDGAGNTLVAGGTNSTNIRTTPTAIYQGRRGGIDGFIMKISPSGDSIVAATYIGTSRYDQNYFVQLDAGDSVYVVGQTEGNYRVTPSTVYSEQNGGQFIHKLTPNLDSTVFSMVFGSNRAQQVDIALSAFLVNDCDHIYVSGWGGRVNAPFMAGSSTNNLTTTAGAEQSSTDGSDFYLFALAENGDSLIYASFFGSPVSDEHVDGGTSRFDKKGIVYQAVCAGCGGVDEFPTTTNSWSEVNGSPNCNLGVIKFDMSKPFSDIRITRPPFICVPDTVYFGNASYGTDFFWDFGDGQTSRAYRPVHVYTDTGTYEVMLIVSDSALCVTTDTSFVTLRAYPATDLRVETPDPICHGESVQLRSVGGEKFQWIPANGLSNDTIPNPIATPDTSTVYQLVSSNKECTDTIGNILVEVFQDLTDVLPDTGVCVGEELILQASGGVEYRWSPEESLSDPNIAQPFANPTRSTAYFVVITDGNECVWLDTVNVEVNDLKIKFVGDTVACVGEPSRLTVQGADFYKWQPSELLDNDNVSNPTAIIRRPTQFNLIAENIAGCVKDTTFTLGIRQPPELDAGIDRIIGWGSWVLLEPIGDGAYEWEPPVGLDCEDCKNPVASPEQKTVYKATLTDEYGCQTTDSVTIFVSGSIYVPNAFTPNSDGTNDFFKVYATELDEFELKIFNRWGEIIYETEDIDGQWDGTLNGKQLPSDAYVWKIKFVEVTGASGSRRGLVNLIR